MIPVRESSEVVIIYPDMMTDFLDFHIGWYSHPKMTGWWLSPTPLKNMKVSWDYDVPNIWKKTCSKHQPVDPVDHVDRGHD